MIKTKSKLSNWINYTIKISPSIFTKELIKINLNKFWTNVVETELKDDQHIIFLFRIQWSDNQFVSIGNLQKLNIEDKDYILNKIVEEMIDKGGYYLEQSIISLTFTYAIRKGKAIEKVINTNIQCHNYQHHKLPITMNPLEYGKLIDKFGDTYIVSVNPKNIASITQLENSNEVKFYKSAELTYEWIDKWIDSNTFSRTLGRKEWIFKNNEQILFKTEKSGKFMKTLVRSDTLQNKFISMDIETFIKDGIHTPYAISWFDGENSFSYYLTDFKSSDLMIIHAIKDLMVKKYDNYKVYIHNLARFDGIFLLRILANLGQIKPKIRNDEIIYIDFRYKDYNVSFRDSKQLLNHSLRDLGKSFNVDIQKSIFPYSFVNEDNLNYIGEVPNINYFDGVNQYDFYDYENKFNSNWSIKDETIKYCEIDCISLYQIILKFNELIFEHFKVNIHKYPTLSSLAIGIYRSAFMENNLIPQLSGQIAKDIRQGYTGGAVDMYIPENPEGTKIHAYDVNSLYPFTMDEFDMPTGKPVLFEGDIRKIDPNAFGFFYCKIKTPTDLEHPILQSHIKNNSVSSTMAPLGQWSDMVFSVEMDNAVKFGYDFEILWGYTFERKNIFKEYVDNLYKFRLEYPKSNPLNLIAKLLMNSLYGRFGMNDSFPNIEILTEKEFYKFVDESNDGEIINFIKLDDKTMVTYRSSQADINTMLDGNKETHNVSIAIAAAITAYARIHMSQFKNNPDFNLYYSDTDSAYIDRPLPEHMVNNKILGKMKLENSIDKAIFLAPKMYYLEAENGKVIYKVKGLSHDVELTKDDFENLLFKESTLQKIQTKWIKFLSKGHIQVLDQMYTMKVTENKRKLIYKNGKLIGTQPFIINDKKEILNK